MDSEGAARIRALVQAVRDLAGAGLSGTRMLDLGAGDGEIAAEFALRGARVVAVEGRETNAAAIRDLRDSRGLGDRIEVVVADVRSLDWHALGRFDVIVCSGLLYHLGLADAVQLAHSMRAACERLTLVDTEVAWGPVEHRNGYAGLTFREQPETSNLASLDNERSFWLTRASLHALLHDAGFASSWELGAPGQPRREQRATVAAVPGKPVEGLLLEPDAELPAARPEEPSPGRLGAARLAIRRRIRR